jgi:hypothetical protein
MVLLWFATDASRNGMDAIKWQEAADQLASLEKILDKALSETNS